MPYVVSDACTWSQARSCVSVCPVDCFYADDELLQLHIGPDECIDCGACEPECPSRAIRFEESADHPDVVFASERVANAARPAAALPPREPLAEDEHRARRDAFLADLARAATLSASADLVRSIEAWLPHVPLAAREDLPRPPPADELRELLALLRACFPDRWAERVEDVRSLLVLPPWPPLAEGEGDGSD